MVGMVVVVVVTVVGYCGSVFVVVAVTPVIRLIESDSFIISLVYSWLGDGCGVVVLVLFGCSFLMNFRAHFCSILMSFRFVNSQRQIASLLFFACVLP